HDVAILAGAWLRLVCVHDEIMRAAVGLLRHEGPFEAGRKARAATAAQTRLLHFVENPVAALRDDFGGAIPIAALAGSGKAPVLQAVEIGENPVLVFQHQLPPPVSDWPTVVRLVSSPRGSDA